MNSIDIRNIYENSNKKKLYIIFLCILAVVIIGLYFVTIGVADTSIIDVINALMSDNKNLTSTHKIIILIRLPRILMAVISGIGLSVSGVAMQSVTRNPLVSPFTMGISSSSAFGASMCIVFGTGLFFKSELGIIFCAFLSSLICIFVVYLISVKAGMSAETVVLIGIGLNYFFNALTSTIEFFAQEHKLAAVIEWTFGTLNGIVWKDVIFSGSIIIVCVILIMIDYLKLNVMSSGDDELVKSLGINPKVIRIKICIISVFATAGVISFTGVIGFIGLVAPHIARIIIGNDHKYLIPFSAIVGSLLLMISDTIGKTILSPVNIPVGIVVSFLGVPLFINLILREKRRKLY